MPNPLRKTLFLNIIIVFSVLAMTGCASVIDYSSYVQHYEQQYHLANPYLTHKIPHGDNFLHAREFGAVNSSVTIILMHGFPDSLHLYDRVAPLLAKKHRVITFDFLGWGNSDKPKGHDYDARSLRSDLEAIITHFKLTDVVLVAHDASGFPAIDWALDNSNKTKLLVLLNTVYSPMKSTVAPEAIALFSTPGLMRSIRRWGANQSDGLWQQGLMEQTSKFYSNPIVRDKYIKIFAQQALEIRPAFFGLNEVLQAEIKDRQEAIPQMRKYTKPVAIIFGGDDPYLNIGVAKEFNEIFSNPSLTIVKNAGHYVQLDKPIPVSNAILEAIINN